MEIEETTLEMWNGFPKHFLVEVAARSSVTGSDTGDFRYMVAWDQCESPIEQLFLCAAAASREFLVISPEDVGANHEYMCHVYAGMFEEPTFVPIIQPQVAIKGCRVDFVAAFEFQGRDGQSKLVRYAVECDGHEYHERTKEQAARDRAKDRMLQSNGFKVFRFTGAEIWRDAFGCALQLEDAMRSDFAQLLDIERESIRILNHGKPPRDWLDQYAPTTTFYDAPSP